MLLKDGVNFILKESLFMTKLDIAVENVTLANSSTNKEIYVVNHTTMFFETENGEVFAINKNEASDLEKYVCIGPKDTDTNTFKAINALNIKPTGLMPVVKRNESPKLKKLNDELKKLNEKFEEDVDKFLELAPASILEAIDYAKRHNNKFPDWVGINVVNADDLYCSAIIKLLENEKFNADKIFRLITEDFQKNKTNLKEATECLKLLITRR